ncbi:MAG TPA: SurA N-terminal domain-containing protein [Rectinemataceae bacterium]|nr:SurA N-terminal domain-containing protein [Rectinemataceae bacterium]
MASQINNPEGAEVKKVQKKTQKRGVKNPFVYGGTIVILIITVIAFVFIPSIGGGLSSSNQAPKFGSWDGKSITYTTGSYFATQVAQINDYLRQQGLSEQNFQLYAYQVWHMAFQSAAIRTGVIQTVQKSGFRLTEKGLDEAIATLAEFQQDGKFSIEKYNQTPAATRLSLRKSTKEDYTVRRYYEDLYTLAPSTAEIAFVASMAKPERSIAYVTLPLSDFPAEEVAAWGNKNSDLFRTLGVSRITITSSEADAKKILGQVRENKLSFEDAAKSHSQDAYADKGGDAGSVYYYLFAEGFANKDDAAKVAALPKGEISDVYKIADKAWSFFKINSELAMADFGKQSTLDEVKLYINDKEKGTLESWAIAKANSLVSTVDGAQFQVAAKKAGLAIKSAGPFIVNIGNPTFYAYNQQIPLLQTPFQNSDPALQAAEQDEAFMTELFTQTKGKVSKPLVVGDNVIVFAVTEDKEASDDDTIMVKFAYPYFHQQTADTQTRDTFLKSKKLKDEFNATFFKIFNTSNTAAAQTSTSATTETPTTEAPKAAN